MFTAVKQVLKNNNIGDNEVHFIKELILGCVEEAPAYAFASNTDAVYCTSTADNRSTDLPCHAALPQELSMGWTQGQRLFVPDRC